MPEACLNLAGHALRSSLPRAVSLPLRQAAGPASAQRAAGCADATLGDTRSERLASVDELERSTPNSNDYCFARFAGARAARDARFSSLAGASRTGSRALALGRNRALATRGSGRAVPVAAGELPRPMTHG